MAQTTPNFGFNIAEGTDTVNLLTQCYPNFTSLDSILQAIKETGVTTAVATRTGTNFAIVRTDTDCNFFRFIATANYVAGDTFTVDGVAVTATSPAGTALPAGAFVINQSVIAVLNSSVLTLFIGGGAANIDAADVDYDNSISGLTATNVQAAIDEVLGDIPAGFAATAITYSNAVSGLAATNAQAAVDELADRDDFSTSEQVVGKWIDGRTLYRKAYSGNTNQSATFVIDAALKTGVVTPVKYEGVIKYAGTSWQPLLNTFSGAATSAWPVINDSTGLNMVIQNLTINGYILAVYYVKE